MNHNKSSKTFDSVLRTYLGREDLPRRIGKERFLEARFQRHICML